MSGRRRCALGAVLLVGIVSSCAGSPEAGPVGSPDIAPVVDAKRNQLATLFTVDDVDEDIYRFGVYDAFPLPDGTVAVLYDLAAESAGDETPRRPRLAILGDAGALAPIELPALAGAAVDPSATLLGAAPDGTIYLWDRDPGRVVARASGGDWRVLPIDLRVTKFAPPAAVGADGSLYLADDDAVRRLDTDGTLTTVIDVYRVRMSSEEPPVPPVPQDQLPLPAASLRLPHPRALAVGADGTVFVATNVEILAVGTDGMVSLVADSATLLAEVGARQPAGYPGPGELGIDADGSLLASYFYEQLVIKVADSGASVLLPNAALVSNGVNASFSPGSDLLVRVLDPDAHLAGPRDPDELAAYGR